MSTGNWSVRTSSSRSGSRQKSPVWPESRAIAGISSGGICAFTVAWERPDQFRKVLSWVGSFTNIAAGASQREGGHNYPALIRRVPKKPIRVFMQDGEQDRPFTVRFSLR